MQWVCNCCRDQKHKADMAIRNKLYWRMHKDKIKDYYEKNKEARAICVKRCNQNYYKKHKEQIKKQTKEWYSNNIDKMRAWQVHYEDNIRVKKPKDKVKQNKKYRLENPEHVKWLQQQYRKNNRHLMNERKRLKAKTDIVYKLLGNCRSRLRGALKHNTKSKRTVELLGCSPTELKLYLEKQFKAGMTWGNHGYGFDKWHIDHIIPCSSFDLSKIEEQNKCFNYTNLQPLWQHENLKKGDTTSPHPAPQTY
jgi:hypothetical protein